MFTTTKLIAQLNLITSPGIATHHMNGTRDSLIEYENRLRRLEPVVRQLSRKSHIIWFSQTPIIQTCCTRLDSDAMYSPTTQNKIDHYNDIARQLLK